MQLIKISISNFKALKNVELPLSSFVCVIGQNNAGKSSLLQALSLLIEGKKQPTTSFYNESEDIVIQGWFENITESTLDLITDQEQRSRVRYAVVEGRLCLVRRISPNGTARLRWITYVPKDLRFSSEYIDALCANQRASATFCARVKECFPELSDKVDNKTSVGSVRKLIDELTRDIPLQQKDEQEVDISTGIEASLRSIMPEPIYIPAVKDLLDEVRTRDATPFGKLLGMLLNVIASELTSTDKTFENLNKMLNVCLGEAGMSIDERLAPVRHIESTIHGFVKEQFPTVGIQLAIPPPELKTILSSARIIVNDGVAGDLESKGDGLKRSVTFAILRAYANLKRDPAIVPSASKGPGYLLLFEEPELYLHPSAQRILFDALRDIAMFEQIVISTHSPLFFSHDATEVFVKIVKQNAEIPTERPYSIAFPVELKDLGQKERFQLISFETSNSAFFYSTILLVEGDTDVLLFPYLARTMNPEWCVHKKGIAVCKINGKSSIDRYRKFFSRFDVRVVVLADLDCVIDGFEYINSDARCAEKLARLYEAIDAFYRTEWARKAAIDSAGSPIPPFNETYRNLMRLGLLKSVSNGTIREIYESEKKKEQWMELAAKYDECLAGNCTSSDFKAAGDAFFSRQVSKDRRTILEGHATPLIEQLKHDLLIALREHDIYLLSKGPIEAYIPASCRSKSDKPLQAFKVRIEVKDSESVRSLCDDIPIDEEGSVRNEFEHIFQSIFR